MIIADTIFTTICPAWYNIGETSAVFLIISSFLYTIEIYCDFSGYSDIAIGISKIMGIRIFHNFDYPYFARNVQEFWRKWHISLTSWFMDYVYIPLGGSRCSKIKNYFNIMAVFTLSGLWHGANLTFILWDFIMGFY